MPDINTAIKIPYPLLTLSHGRVKETSLPGRKKQVRFELRDWAFDPEEAIDQVVLPALRIGAKVLVVMNTVGRAVRMFRAAESCSSIDPGWLFTCEGQTCAHHGRFAPEDRKVLDNKVSARLGKNGPPGPVLLIGTQTLEQSLDLDADLLITDLAPSDVLLQRVGRLQRHDFARPVGYEDARCFVLATGHDLETAIADNGVVSRHYKRIGYGSVYEDLRVLELTRRLLMARPDVVIPDDNRFLVENATHPDVLALLDGERWKAHCDELYNSERSRAVAAYMAANTYDEYFGKARFAGDSRTVTTRLGVDSYLLSLDRSVISPFGVKLSSMLIPGHMIPAVLTDGSVVVESSNEGTTILRCEGRRYKYTKYGLEALS